jgi:8-oxo-(d)GTP phosphatase
LLLLRHASAGERMSSPAEDRFRALDRVGRAEARRMRDLLGRFAIDRIVTSPHVRCVETVGPIARARRLEIEQRVELEPDAALADILALLAELPDATLVCTHREVIERLFGTEVSCEKGGCLRLERLRGGWAPVDYMPPPRTAPSTRTKAALV